MTRPQGRIAVVIVVAVAENGVIGSADGLPWRLKSDLRHFRALTLDKPIVMGRKTWLTLGRPLDRRTNIVISRDPAFAAPGVVAAGSLDTALAIARADAWRRGAEAVMIVGGAEIYAQALPRADRMEMTLVHMAARGETRFPPVDRAVWQEVARQDLPAGPGDDTAFTFLRLERTPAAGTAEGRPPCARAGG